MGKHQSPPAPIWAPPIDDMPFARFEWGTDARMDNNELWWSLNVIKNDPQSVPLAVNWDKGGIFISLLTPLPKGEPHCNNMFLEQGRNNIPVLDPDAPIVYSSNRRHDAAVYIGSEPHQASSTAPDERPKFATTSISTSFQDNRLGLRHVTIEVSSNGPSSDDPKRYELFLYKPNDLIVGISEFPNALDTDQLDTLRRAMKGQGFSVEQASLVKFSGAEQVKQLFWSTEASIPPGELLFVSNGSKGIFTYHAPPTARPVRRQAMLIILDENRQPIAADKIAVITPVTSK